MDDETIFKATGRSGGDWFDLIRQQGMAEASHKDIADWLHTYPEVSYWWAQTITVEYEKHVGRRVVGQTQSGLYQIGVTRTIDAAPEILWAWLTSPEGLAALAGVEEADSIENREGGPGPPTLASLDGMAASGIALKTTTYREGSHVRMQWQAPGWENPSILQVRVNPKPDGRAALAFHQEKIPDGRERDVLRDRWRGVAEKVAAMLEGKG